MKTRFSRKALAPAFAILALTGGCNNYRGLESAHQPVVSRTDYVFDVATDGYGMARGEPQRLAGWMSSLRLGYGDTINVDDPTSSPAVRAQVAAEASRFGLLIASNPPVTVGEVTPGTARIVVTRSTAFVPDCPDHEAIDFANFDQHTSTNFGCAINSNLASMVARPEDLVRGQSGDPSIDPATSGKAINQYRNATPSGGGGQTVKSESPAGGSN